MLQLLNSLIGDSRIMQAGVIFAVGVAIALTLIIVFRMIFQSRVRSVATGGKASRLAVVDVFDLDRTRQLVLVRRDQVEHLVMIGGPNDLVVETGIIRSAIPTREKERAGDKDAAQSPPAMPVHIDARIQKAIEDRSSDTAAANIVEVKTSELNMKPAEDKPRPVPPAAPVPPVVPVPSTVPVRTGVGSVPHVRPVVGYGVNPPEAAKSPVPVEAVPVAAPPVSAAEKPPAVATAAPVAAPPEVQPVSHPPEPAKDTAEAPPVVIEPPVAESAQTVAAPALPEAVAASAPEVVLPREDQALPIRRQGARAVAEALGAEETPPDSSPKKTVTDKPVEPKEDPQKVFDRTPFISRPVPQPRTLTPLSARQPSGSLSASASSRPVTPAKPSEQKRPQIALQPVAPPLPEAEPQAQAADVLLPIDELELEMARLLGRPVKLD